MLWEVLVGTAAGAVGTVALNMTTYLDMALRGRPPSSVSAKVVDILAQKAGIDLATGLEGERVQHRQSGLGALLGYATGLGMGTAYGLMRLYLGNLPKPIAGIGLGLAAMAASDVPSIALGATDPGSWGVAGWTADIVPHLVYGLVTVAAYEAFTERQGGIVPWSP